MCFAFVFVDDKSLPIRSRRVTAGQTSKYKNYVVISKSCERVSSKNRSKQCISGPEIISAGTMPAEAAHQSICGPAVPPIKQCDMDLENASASYAFAADSHHEQDLSTALLQLLNDNVNSLMTLTD